MSHNASAADVSLNARFINGGADRYYSIGVVGDSSCVSWCQISQNTSNTDGLSIKSLQAYLPNGTYYTDNVWELVFTVWKVNSSQSLHSVFNSIQVDNSVSGPWKLMGVNYEQYDTNTTTVHIWVKQVYQYTVNNHGPRFVSSNPNNTFILYLEPIERISFNYWSLWAINDPNAGDNAIVSAIQSMPNYTNNLNNINNNINDMKNRIDNINNDVQDATQDAADDAADSGDQSAADAENATAGLISVIGGFVNAITSATPTNCKINGKINNSFNMGELDLCSMPVPPFVQIISSLILIAICIPFAIIMFNRFIGLFRSFQG